MKFLLKAAFWLTIVLILLPTGGTSSQNEQQVSATDAVSAATATMADMRQFCARQPDTCAFGASAAVTLGHKAQAGAKMLYEYLSDKLGPRETGSIGSGNAAAKAVSSTKPSQNTLAPSDLAPGWRAPRKDVETKRPT